MMKSSNAFSVFFLALLVATLTPQARAQITIGGNGSNSTDSTAYSGNQSLTKIGSNTVTLTGNNTYTGATAINAGTLELSSTGSLYNYGRNAGTINVNNGGTLYFNRQDAFGNADNFNPTAIILNSGGLIQNGAYFNNLFNLTINGGELRANGGSAGGWGAYELSGTVTVGGNQTSLIASNTSINTNNFILLSRAGSTTFNVADATADSSSDLHISATLTDANGITSSLVKTGAGTMLFSGNNSYSGTTTINAGTLQIGNAGTSGTLGTGAVTNNATLNFNRSNAMTVANAISGSGLVVHSGGGNTTLTGSNTYTGGTTVNAGTLIIGSGGSIANNATNTITVNNGGTFTITRENFIGNHSATINTPIIINAGGVFQNSGAVFNALGNLTLNGGTLQANAVEALSSQSFALKGTVTVNGSTTSTIAGNGIALGAAGVTGTTFVVNDGAAATDLLVSGVLRDGAGNSWPTAQASSLTKNGAGKMVLAGNNTYTGTTTINAGSLEIGNGGASGALGSGAVTNNAILVFNRSNAMTVSNTITGTGSLVQSGSGNTTLSAVNGYTGGTTVNAGTLTLNDLANNGNGVIVGNLTVNSGGTVNLTGGGAALGWTATRVSSLNIDGGLVSAAGKEHIWQMSGGLNMTGGELRSNGGTSSNTTGNYFEWGNTTVTTSASASTATISGRINVRDDASPTLTFNVADGAAASDLTVSAAITPSGANAVGVVKNGAGAMTMSGNNTYTGGTTVNAGTLIIGAEGTLANNITNTLTINNGGTVTIARENFLGVHSATINTPIIVNTGGLLQNSGAVFNALGNLTLNGGTLQANAVEALSSQSFALKGTVTVNGSTTSTISGNGIALGAAGVTGTTFVVNDGAAATDLNVTGVLRDGAGNSWPTTQASSLTKNGTGTMVLSGNNTYTGVTTINSGTLLVGNGGSSGSLGSGAVTNNAALVFNRSDSLTAGSVISGNGSVAKLGAGTLILTANNTYTGTTTISGGTLQIGNGGSSGTISAGELSNNGTLAINRSNAVTLGDVISGTGSLIQAGVGTTTLAANNTYTGTTTISGGTLQIGNGGTTGTLGAGALTNNGTLAINRSNTVTLGDVISGTGSLIQAGVGTTTLAANNSYTGTTTISGGTLQIGNGGTTGTLGSGAVTNNASLVINRSDSHTISNAISGTGSLVHNGTGTTTLTGNTTYTGATTINSGTLATSGNNRLATGNTVTINSGGTFGLGGNQTLASVAGSGTIQLGDYILNTGATSSTFSGSMAGNGGLTKSGAGTLTLSGVGSFTGDTNITGGTLILASANALSSDAVVLMNAGTTLTVNQRTFIGALEQGGGTVNGPGSLVATLTLTNNGTLNAVLADGADYAAGILKRTSGTTTIGAANTFTGAIKIQGGTLQLTGNGSFDAASSLVMSAGATMDLNNKSQTFSAVTGQGGTVAMGSGSLTVNNAGTDDYNGVITGTGSLAKSGAGTLTLGGNNTYTGGTTVSGGKLAGTTTSLKGAITNNAQVEFAQDASGTYAGNMGGSGALIKSGSGTVTLTGNNTHSGGTTVTGGKLVAGTANLQGNLANNAAFEIAQNTNGTYTGNITGSGSLTKSGSGTVTLSGTNSYSGGTTVSGGRLVGTTASLQGQVTNNAAVEFDQASNGTYLGAMDGTGTLTKRGAGKIVMSGNSTYTGDTTVEAGQLTVNGALASTVTVQNGATIGGSGRIGGLILETGSTLTPGNSPGTLSVNGDATWNAGANYNWQVYATNTDAAVQTAAGTGWDYMDVNGTLTLGLDPSNKFNLNLWSLSGTNPDTSGQIPGWNPNVGSTWLIASAGSGIILNGNSLQANTNYSSYFNINTAAINGTNGWVGALPNGGFQVVTLGDANKLYLYADPGSAAVPEPSQVAASLLLLVGLGVYVWMKRKKSKATA